MQKITTQFIFIVVLIWSIIVSHSYATSVVLESSQESVDQSQEFYVDVAIDTEGDSINGVQGSIVYSPNLTFIRAEDGNSIIGPWIDRPKVIGDAITFSGIIPNGFDGLIDPFQNHTRKPGNLLRLIFSGNKSGTAVVTSTSLVATKNDGKGTIILVPDVHATVTVSDQTQTQTQTYRPVDTQNPELIATVEYDPKLYDGRATLVFTALDKESGVARVEVQEGLGVFTEVESPYELKDQSRTSQVTVRAIDNAGNVTTVIIEPTYTQEAFTYILGALLALIAVLIFSYVVRKRKQKKGTL